MKEKFLPVIATAGIAVGGIGMSEAQAEEPCVDEEARAMALAAERQGVNADRTAVMLYLALTGQEGRPLSLEEYRLLYNNMVEDILDGQDPMAQNFGNAEPEPTPIVDFTEEVSE